MTCASRCDARSTTMRRSGCSARRTPTAASSFVPPTRSSRILADFRPEAVVNAAGIVKQRPDRRGGDPEPGDQRAAAAPARPRLRRDRRPPRPHEHRLRVLRPQGKLHGDRPSRMPRISTAGQALGEVDAPELHHAAHLDHRPGARAQDRVSSNGSSRRAAPIQGLPQSDLLRVHDHRAGAHHRDAADALSAMPPASTTSSSAPISKFDLLTHFGAAARAAASRSCRTTSSAATAASIRARFRQRVRLPAARLAGDARGARAGDTRERAHDLRGQDASS